VNEERHPFRIWSIPGTGTRFVQSFFHYQGVAPEYFHAGSQIPDIRLVIPLRHPIDCYQTNVHRGNFDMAQFIGWWHELIFRAVDAFIFPIEQKREQIERSACEFVGIPYREGFPWVPVGTSEHDRDRPDVPELAFAVDWFDG